MVFPIELSEGKVNVFFKSKKLQKIEWTTSHRTSNKPNYPKQYSFLRKWRKFFNHLLVIWLKARLTGWKCSWKRNPKRWTHNANPLFSRWRIFRWSVFLSAKLFNYKHSNGHMRAGWEGCWPVAEQIGREDVGRGVCWVYWEQVRQLKWVRGQKKKKKRG